MNDRVKESAIRLSKYLHEYPSFISVGIGTKDNQPVFFVYLNQRDKQTVLAETWEGICIISKYIGKIKPANK